jgi:hypothetical protein
MVGRARLLPNRGFPLGPRLRGHPLNQSFEATPYADRGGEAENAWGKTQGVGVTLSGEAKPGSPGSDGASPYH